MLPTRRVRTTAPRLAALLIASAALGACSSGDGGSAGSGPGTGAGAGTDDGNPLEAVAPTTAPPPDGAAGAAEGAAATDASAMAGAPVVAEPSARYRLTFEATWGPGTHPEGFPPNPHFSPLVGAVHNEQVRFWEPGQLASPGIRIVAETGAGGPFLDEVGRAIASGYASDPIDGGGVPSSPGARSVEFEVTRDYPEITVVTMLAPSPDWFAGVHGLGLLGTDGFVERVELELPLYDAGTDDGTGYVSADAPAEPPGIVARTTGAPGESPFVDGLPSVGRFVIERVR